MVHLFREKPGAAVGPPHMDIEDAIEFVLDHSCPKIRLIRGHKKKLREPVKSALNYAAALVGSLSEPFDVTSEAAVYEVLLKAFFLDQEQLESTLANDPDLNAFLGQSSADVFWVLLSMDRQVKTVFGARQQGEIVLRDVALRAVDFSDHKFRAPSETMAGFQQTLERGVLQILAHWALENVLEEQSRKDELSRLREEVTAKLKMMAAERQDMVLEWPQDAEGQSYRAAQELLETIEAELDAINSQTLDAGYYVSEVARVMNGAHDFLTARQVGLHFDLTGILLEGDGGDGHDGLRVTELRLGHELRRCCVPLKCRQSLLLQPR